MPNLRTIVWVVVALFLSPMAASATPLDIRSVFLTDLGDEVRFSAVFDRAPDFVTVDEYGRNYDAFQLTLTHDMENPYQFRDVWIEGINIQSGLIPVYPMQSDGRFGEPTATVPYEVAEGPAGHVLSFSVPYVALSTSTGFFSLAAFSDTGSGLGGNPGPDPFHWFLDTYQYGESPNESNHAQGQFPVGVPEPTAMMQLGLGIGIGLLSLRKRFT